ncbi:uncharacterized protein LOC109792369 [Cajanus cajan]|nr:uncharacterized protein LOC109792369 [Cajanus cajan]
MELLEVPPAGRLFTWFRPNGTARSKLDRFLVSLEWLLVWPGCTQLVLHRNFSNHCPIVMKNTITDWGPKPFRTLDCWLQENNLRQLFHHSWMESTVQGWSAYVVKEKLKILKGKLKTWNANSFGNIQTRLREVEERMNSLDIKEEEGELDETDQRSKRQLQQQLWDLAKHNESLLRQKSRVRWLLKGDKNTRYFHVVVNWRRRMNSLKGIEKDGVWIQEPNQVKYEVSNYFSNKFSEEMWLRPTLDGVQFSKISNEQRILLTQQFGGLEIKEAVWSCDGSKSPGPDGYNFNFIKSIGTC